MPREQTGLAVKEWVDGLGKEATLLDIASAIAVREGRLNEAATLLRRATEAEPHHPERWHCLGTVLHDSGDSSGALAAYQQVLRLQPQHAVTLTRLAALHRERADLTRALALHRRSLGLPGGRCAESLYQYAMTLNDLGESCEAESLLREALCLNPQHAAAQLALGTGLLAREAFDEGWQALDRYWRGVSGNGKTATLPGRPWRGEPLGRAGLFVVEGPTAGDTIQFSRYLELVRRTHPQARIALWCSRELVVLLEPLARILDVALIARQTIDPVNDFRDEWHVMLMSLPTLFDIASTDVPPPQPTHFAAPVAAVSEWQARLQSFPGLKVGLCLSMPEPRPAYGRPALAALPAELLSLLLEVPGVTWISLQHQVSQRSTARPTPGVLEWPAVLENQAVATPLIQGLDLVVAFDTTVAHLAASLGRPTWVMLSRNSHWSWGRGAACPWYPSVRVFHQAQFNEWQPVVTDLVAQLKTLARGPAGPA